jgi:hypothetical protein
MYLMYIIFQLRPNAKIFFFKKKKKKRRQLNICHTAMHCIYFYFLCLPNVVPDGEQRAEGRSVLLSGFAEDPVTI